MILINVEFLWIIMIRINEKFFMDQFDPNQCTVFINQYDPDQYKVFYKSI